jgi:hypothetical protein
LFRQKDPKPMTPRPASSDGSDADGGGRTNSQGSHKVRHIIKASDPGAGRQASQGHKHFDDNLNCYRSFFGKRDEGDLLFSLKDFR